MAISGSVWTATPSISKATSSVLGGTAVVYVFWSSATSVPSGATSQNSTSTRQPWERIVGMPSQVGQGSTLTRGVRYAAREGASSDRRPRRSGQPCPAVSSSDSSWGAPSRPSSFRKRVRSLIGTTTTGVRPSCGGSTNQVSVTRRAVSTAHCRPRERACAGVSPGTGFISSGSRPCRSGNSVTRRTSRSRRPSRRSTAASKMSIHRSARTSDAYRLEDSIAPSPSRCRRSSSVASRSRALAMPSMESGPTSSPFRSCWMTSRTPEGQSKAATGTPAAMASCTTSGRPSLREVRAEMLALAHSTGMFVDCPGSSTRS